MDKVQIGQLLKSRRESLKLSVQDVVDRTRIKKTYVEAMEAGDFSVFDGPVFIRNFIRTYGRFLGMQDSKLMEMLAESAPAEKPKEVPEPAPEDSTSESDSRDNTLFAIGMWVVVAIVLVGIGVYYFKRSSEEVVEVSLPPVATEQFSAIAPAETEGISAATSVEQSDTPPPPSEVIAPTKHRIELKASTEVWMYVESEERKLERVMQAGDRQAMSFEKFVRLRIGNAGGIQATMDGRELELDTGRSPGRVYDRIFRVDPSGKIVSEKSGQRAP